MNATDCNPDAIVQPRQILVATDLADCNYLLPMATVQARATGAYLTLVHAIINPAISSISAHRLGLEKCGIDAEEFAERILAELVERTCAKGIACDSIVKLGCSPIEALRDEARRTDAKRVIMGTHGRGRVGQLALGSVAKSLLRSLDIPIFAIGPHVSAPVPSVTPRRILHPVSLHGFYRENIDVACRLAEFHQAELILMYTIAPNADGGKISSQDLNDLKSKHHTVGVKDMSIPILNFPAQVGHERMIDDILQSASRLRADWIVLGCDIKGDYAAFIESAAYQVMAATSVPVFTLPNTRHIRAQEHSEIPLSSYEAITSGRKLPQ